MLARALNGHPNQYVEVDSEHFLEDRESEKKADFMTIIGIHCSTGHTRILDQVHRKMHVVSRKKSSIKANGSSVYGSKWYISTTPESGHSMLLIKANLDLSYKKEDRAHRAHMLDASCPVIIYCWTLWRW
jgi:hypothetical protein